MNDVGFKRIPAELNNSSRFTASDKYQKQSTQVKINLSPILHVNQDLGG